MVIERDEASLSSEALIELIRITLSKDAPFRLKVKGSSMSPFVKDGDIVIISSLRNTRLNFGQLAAFVMPSSGKLVIHRMVGKNKDGFVAKGDGVSGIDGLIPGANVLGLVAAIERGGKPIKFGLGPERILIGLLSRFRLLPFCSWVWMSIPATPREFIKRRVL